MFGVPGWYISIETAYKEEAEHGLKAATLTAGTGAVGSSGEKAHRPGVFMEILMDGRRLMELEYCR